MNNGEDWGEETYALAERAIGYTFQDKSLLKTCFTHRSYTNFCKEPNNERLEFLGDAVLGLCVTENLFRNDSSDEGKLTELRKQYVSKTALSRAEERAGLMRFLRYSGGKSNVNGKTASNLFEAVVAGIYLDGGMAEVRKFLDRFLSVTQTENHKTLLQEFVQERTKTPPVYRVEERNGGYCCRVSALGKKADGFGESKKAAETEAAKKLFAKLNKELKK